MDASAKGALILLQQTSERLRRQAQGCRWTAETTRRYETLLNIAGDLSGKQSSLRMRQGRLLWISQRQGISVNYSGIDVNENLITLARSKFPETEFIATDIEESGFNREFDLIFICAYQPQDAGVEESMKDVLRILFKLCREALTLISSLIMFRREALNCFM